MAVAGDPARRRPLDDRASHRGGARVLLVGGRARLDRGRSRRCGSWRPSAGTRSRGSRRQTCWRRCSTSCASGGRGRRADRAARPRDHGAALRRGAARLGAVRARPRRPRPRSAHRAGDGQGLEGARRAVRRARGPRARRLPRARSSGPRGADAATAGTARAVFLGSAGRAPGRSRPPTTSSRARSVRRSAGPSGRTRCATPRRRTCSTAARTCAPCRRSSATRVSARPRSTRTSRASGSPPPTGSRTRGPDRRALRASAAGEQHRPRHAAEQQQRVDVLAVQAHAEVHGAGCRVPAERTVADDSAPLDTACPPRAPTRPARAW